MAWTFYNRGKFHIAKNDMSIADLRMLVIAGASLPSGASDIDLNTVSQVLAVSGVVEAAASGYVRKDLAGVTLTEDDTLDKATITWTAPTWTAVAAGETWRAVLLYDEGGGTDATRNLIGIDDTADVATAGVDITYTGGSVSIA